MQKKYNVSTTARLTGVHPQTLRYYETIGLIHPRRTIGGVRRYNEWNIQQLREIRKLANRGVNLEGIKIILELTEENNILRHQLAVNKGDTIFTAGSSGDVNIEQYAKLSLINRIRLFRSLRKKDIENPTLLQIEGGRKS
ncbi:MAG: MerR family transcriptional regulator [Candidatus Ancillula trichonymphae]|jgi:MerR family transcriptional regulator/heat shock protein HspR|nr:MerR family transcriptional regulator [Candidatus Ancillula trichonymphae]